MGKTRETEINPDTWIERCDIGSNNGKKEKKEGGEKCGEAELLLLSVYGR